MSDKSSLPICHFVHLYLNSHSQPLWALNRGTKCTKMTLIHLFLYKLIFDMPTSVHSYLSPVADDNGGRDGIPDIWDDNLDLAAVCCCTRTSAASARCIKVFLSGLSSKFLQPTHLQEPEHIILAYNRIISKNTLLTIDKCSIHIIVFKEFTLM